MSQLTLPADLDPEVGWPDEMEAEPDTPPADDFDLSRLWRRARREQAQAERLKRYLARVTEFVDAIIERRLRRVEEIKQLTIVYLAQQRVNKVVMPDLGTVHLTRRKRVDLDPAAALAWAQAEAPHLVLHEPKLDREGLKRHLLDTGEVLPGVAVVEEVTSVAFRPR